MVGVVKNKAHDQVKIGTYIQSNSSQITSLYSLVQQTKGSGIIVVELETMIFH
jgi:hypothetical protein